MQGRAFLDLAREVVPGGTEVHRRATVIHAYYAMFLECREALTRWGIVIPLHQNVHSSVRLHFLYAAEADLKSIGLALDTWGQRRNDASYNLAPLRKFASDHIAQDAIAEAVAILAVLDAIETDSARRAAAIAAFPP